MTPISACHGHDRMPLKTGNVGLVDSRVLGLDTPAGVHSGACLVFAAKQIEVIFGWMLTVLG